jgi:hypothetical protein
MLPMDLDRGSTSSDDESFAYRNKGEIAAAAIWSRIPLGAPSRTHGLDSRRNGGRQAWLSSGRAVARGLAAGDGQSGDT